MLKKDRAKILIVDDEPEIRESLSTILSDKGYYCDTASTGLEALNKMGANIFDVALVDIQLPDMDGTQLVSQFQKNNPRLINIMVTGYPALENAINALNEGAHGYVVKPVDLEKLLGLIEQNLEKRIQSEDITEDKMVDWVKKRVEHLS